MTANNSRLASNCISTYNRSNDNMFKVIESSLGQTYTNIEVILADYFYA